jgi:hypothetical protein
MEKGKSLCWFSFEILMPVRLNYSLTPQALECSALLPIMLFQN